MSQIWYTALNAEESSLIRDRSNPFLGALISFALIAGSRHRCGFVDLTSHNLGESDYCYHYLSHSETNRANCRRSPVLQANVTDWNGSVPLTIVSRASLVRSDKVWAWTRSEKG